MTRGFILGNPRSGTSLLRIMLNSHPKIVAPPECGFLQWWFEDYGDWSAKDTRNADRIQAFVSDVLSSRKIETWEISAQALTNTIDQRMPSTYGELCECVYLTWAHRHGHSPSVIMDKNNYYLHHAETLDTVWPDAKYVYIVRDGRDVVTSYRKVSNLKTSSPYKPNLPTDVRDIAEEWSHNNEKIICFLKSIPKTRWTFVKYEEIVREDERNIKNICDFVNLEYDSKIKEFYKYNDEPEKTIDWKRKTLGDIDSSRIGRYKRELSEEEIKKFENDAEPTLKRLGYV